MESVQNDIVIEVMDASGFLGLLLGPGLPVLNKSLCKIISKFLTKSMVAAY